MEIIKFDDEPVTLNPIKPTELSGNTEMVDVAAIKKELAKPTEQFSIGELENASHNTEEVVSFDTKTDETTISNSKSQNLLNLMNFAYVYGSNYTQFVNNITKIVESLEKADLPSGAYDEIAEQISSVPEVYGYDTKNCEQKDINAMKVLGARIAEYQSAQVNTNNIKYGDVIKEIEVPALSKKM